MNLMMLLEMAASGFGDRPALTNGSEVLTYSELFGAAGAAASEITASESEYMAVLDVNSLAVPIGLFASAWAGVPFAPLNYRLTGPELDALLARVSPAYLVTDTESAKRLSPSSGTTVVERGHFVERAMAGSSSEASWSLDPEEIAVLLFTSGTTGAPKAALLRHKHLVS